MTKTRTKTRTKKYLMTLAALLLLCIPIAVSATQATRNRLNQAEEDLNTATRELSERQNLLAGTEFEMSQVMAEMENLDRRIENAMISLENIEDALALTERRIYDAEFMLETARYDRDLQYEVFRSRLRAMHENAPVNMVEVLFQANSITDFFARIEFVRAVAKVDLESLERLTGAEENVNTIIDRLDRDRNQVLDLVHLAQIEVQNLEDALVERELWLLALMDDADRLAEAVAVAEAEAYEFERIFAQIGLEYAAEQERIYRQSAARRQSERLAALNDFNGEFMWPIPTHGRVGSRFGYRTHPILRTREFHRGIDVGAATGTPLYAAADGYVRFVGWMNGFGNVVIIDHGAGYSTVYAHNSRNRVTQGQRVNRGDHIADVGSTGMSTSPHLHFEIRRNNVAVDPQDYFPPFG